MNLKYLPLLLVLLPVVASAQDPAAPAAPPYTVQFYLCMGSSDGSKEALLNCIDAEMRSQESRLNGTYQYLLGSFPAAKRPALQHVQHLWWRYRDANCRLSLSAADPQLSSLTRSNCLLEITAKRADELEVLLP